MNNSGAYRLSSDSIKITACQVNKKAGKRSWFDNGSHEATTTVDSGATEHAVNSLAYFEEVAEIEKVHPTIADGSRASATHKGKIMVMVRNQLILLQNVYYVPTLQRNILSCTQMDQRKISKTIAKGKCSYWYKKENNRNLGSIFLDKKEQLYLVPVKVPKSNRSKQDTVTIRRASSMQRNMKREQIDAKIAKDLWLKRLAHANTKAISHMLSIGKIECIL